MNEGITFQKKLSVEKTRELAVEYYPSDGKLLFTISCAYSSERGSRSNIKGRNAAQKLLDYQEWMYDIKDPIARQSMDDGYGNALKREADIEHQNELAERI